MSQKHVRVMNRFEREFTPIVYKAMRMPVDGFIKDMKAYGIDTAMKNLDILFGSRKMGEALLSIYKVVGSYFADKTLYELRGQENKGFGLNIDWVKELMAYFNSLLLSKAVLPITETTKRAIREVLNHGQREGWGVDKIVQELNSDELMKWRARMIVRTETNKAMFYGQKLGESKSEFESTKMWIATNDHRTRHSHRLVDGKVVDTDERFAVPTYKDVGPVEVQIGMDMMEGPGDPKASAGNVINCRCTIARRLKRIDGQLVPKKIGSVAA